MLAFYVKIYIKYLKNIFYYDNNIIYFIFTFIINNKLIMKRKTKFILYFIEFKIKNSIFNILFKKLNKKIIDNIDFFL